MTEEQMREEIATLGRDAMRLSKIAIAFALVSVAASLVSVVCWL